MYNLHADNSRLREHCLVVGPENKNCKDIKGDEDSRSKKSTSHDRKHKMERHAVYNIEDLSHGLSIIHSLHSYKWDCEIRDGVSIRTPTIITAKHHLVRKGKRSGFQMSIDWEDLGSIPEDTLFAG